MKYRYHQKNSRKGYVHREFDLWGAADARAIGAKLGLAEATINIWIRRWEKRLDLAPYFRNR